MNTEVRCHNVVRLVAGAALFVSVVAVILILGVGDAGTGFHVRAVALPWVIVIGLAVAAIAVTLPRRR